MNLKNPNSGDVRLTVKGRVLDFSVTADGTVFHQPTSLMLGSIRLLTPEKSVSKSSQHDIEKAVETLVNQQIRTHGNRVFFDAIGLNSGASRNG
jgi:hypothetical protein